MIEKIIVSSYSIPPIQNCWAKILSRLEDFLNSTKDLLTPKHCIRTLIRRWHRIRVVLLHIKIYLPDCITAMGKFKLGSVVH